MTQNPKKYKNPFWNLNQYHISLISDWLCKDFKQSDNNTRLIPHRMYTVLVYLIPLFLYCGDTESLLWHV